MHLVTVMSGITVPFVHVAMEFPTIVNPEKQLNFKYEPEATISVSGSRVPFTGGARLKQSRAIMDTIERQYHDWCMVPRFITPSTELTTI